MDKTNKKNNLSWEIGGTMIGVATFYDLIIGIIGLLNFTIIGFVVVIVVAWIPSLFAFMTFALWFTIKGEMTMYKISLLLAPLTSGCVGVPAWAATIWPLVAKTIASNKLSAVPGLNSPAKLGGGSKK